MTLNKIVATVLNLFHKTESISVDSKEYYTKDFVKEPRKAMKKGEAKKYRNKEVIEIDGEVVYE